MRIKITYKNLLFFAISAILIGFLAFSPAQETNAQSWCDCRGYSHACGDGKWSYQIWTGGYTCVRGGYTRWCYVPGLGYGYYCDWKCFEQAKVYTYCCDCSTPAPTPTPVPTPPPPPPCSCESPSGLSITSPATGTTGVNPDGLKIDWTFSSWGVDSGRIGSCSNASGNDSFSLYYTKTSGDTSDSPPSPPPASPISISRDARTYTLYNLDGNSTYDIRLVANNGCGTTGSQTITITTENRPRIDNVNATTVCPPDTSRPLITYWSGAAGANSSVTNPANFRTVFSDVNGAGNISYVMLQIDQTANNPSTTPYKYLRVMYVQSRSGYNSNSFYLWDEGQWKTASGLIDGSYAKVYISPTESRASQSGNTLTVDWKIEFENAFENGRHNFYIYIEDLAGAQDRSSGAVTQTNITPSLPVGNNWHTLPSLREWGVDTLPPTVTQPTPTVIDGDTVEIRWAGGDPTSGIRSIEGFCWQNGGQPKNMTKVRPAPTVTQPLATSDPDPSNNLSVRSNCLASLRASAIYRYDLPSSVSSISSFSFKTKAIDNACNIATDSQVQNINRPWILTYGNNTHTGSMSITLPDLSIDSIFKGTAGAVLARTEGNAFVSTYIESSTTTDLPIKASRYSYTATTYNDLNVNPPEKSGAENNYDYLYSVVSQNTNLKTIPASAFTGKTSTSSIDAVRQGSAVHYLVQGDLTIGDSTSPRVFNCDTKTIIFIEGNLTIGPDIVATGNDNGCVLIARGNVTVTNGDYKNNGNTGANSPSRYDRIDAFIVANGTYTVLVDDAGTTKKDGLMVKGSVITQGIDLQRNLGQQNNLSGPSEGIVFDPRYILTPEFRNAFSIGGFSIREVGFDQ